MAHSKKIIEKSAWLYLFDKRILMTRSKNKKSFYIPGGKPEPGETNEEALVREINEELSVSLLPETIQFAETFEARADGHPEHVIVRMNCFYGAYEGTLSANAEIAEYAWFSHQDKDRASFVDRIIFDWLKNNEELI